MSLKVSYKKRLGNFNLERRVRDRAWRILRFLGIRMWKEHDTKMYSRIETPARGGSN